MPLAPYRRIAFAVLFAGFASLPAQAQLFRSYLASDGSDANPCTLVSPCRLLPKALSVVADGGEIWMLDSANYNTTQVAVTKSVTILAVPGALGSVVAAGGNALSIATAGVKVTLRNLVIVPLPGAGGTGGVSMTNGLRLTIEGCSISGIGAGGYGVYAVAAAEVQVVDSMFRDNDVALYLDLGASGTISSSKFLGSTSVGIFVNGTSGTTTAAVSDTTITGLPGAVGVFTQGETGATTRVSVVRSTISNNIIGVMVGGGGASRTASIGASMLTGNGTGLLNEGSGTLESLGNNLVSQNGTNTTGTISALAPL